MSTIPLQRGIIYGPVASRRLGRSLGVNLLPTNCKLCSFDCVYCHYGRTQVKTLHPEENAFPSMEEVLNAVEAALQGELDFDYLTFSGNGEPTLHPCFAEIVFEVRIMRDRLRPQVKLAILSNSSTAHLVVVREALALVDVPIMKLDAGDERTLTAVNRPVAGVSLEQIMTSLKGLPELVVQSVLIDGKVSNIWGAPYEAWLSALADLGPAQVQIYSTDRPVPEAGIEKVKPVMLQRVAREIEGCTGLQVQAYWA
jgi:wyosine [tRNA(Phe)-imidazoG37] synthetase (radical SAM superfamily)